MPEPSVSAVTDDIFISERERRIISEVLNAGVDPEINAERSKYYFGQMLALGDGLAPALAHSLNHQNPFCAVLAACMLFKLREKGMVVPNHLNFAFAKAEEVIVRALHGGDVELRIETCMRLSSGCVPQQAIPLLSKFLKHENSFVSIYAAAALTWCGEAAAPAIAILSRAMHGDDERLAAVAAEAMGRLGLRSAEAISVLIHTMGRGNFTRQYATLLAIRDLGPPAAAACPKLIEIAKNDGNNSQLRAAAAEAIGSVCPHDKTVQKLLVSLAQNEDWKIIDGAILGLRRMGGNLPPKALSQLVSLLDSPSADHRRVAVLSLRGEKSLADSTTQTLIASLCREQDRDILLESARTCASFPSQTVQPLCDAISAGGGIRDMGPLSLALIMLEEAAAIGITNTLLSHSDELIRVTGVNLLKHLGSAASPAFPMLAEILPRLDDEKAMGVYVILAKHAKAATIAIPAVIDCLLERTGEASQLAGKLLEIFGDQAIASLKERRKTVGSALQAKIDQVLAAFKPVEQPRFEKLLTLNSDKELLLFVLMAEMLESAGNLGLRKISNKLEQSQRAMALGIPTSEASLRDMLKKLNDRTSTELTRQSSRGSSLSDEGKALLHESRQYLLSRGFQL